MIALAVLLVLSVLVIVTLCFLVGFRPGGDSWVSEVQRVRAEAAAAERQLHELTRSAFVAMADEAQRGRLDGKR